MVKPRENRVPIMMSDEELKAIDDWRFSCRIATRSEAIRRLCKTAFIAAPPFLPARDMADNAVGRAVDIQNHVLEVLELTEAGNSENALQLLDEIFTQSLDLTELLETLRLTLSGTFVKIEDLSEATTLRDGDSAVQRRSEEVAQHMAEIRERYRELRKR